MRQLGKHVGKTLSVSPEQQQPTVFPLSTVHDSTPPPRGCSLQLQRHFVLVGNITTFLSLPLY